MLNKKKIIIMICTTAVFVNMFWNGEIYASVKDAKNTSSAKSDYENKLKINVNGTVKEVVVSFDYDMAEDMFDLINDYRKQNGVEPLVWNYGLSKGAQIRAVEITYNFDHRRPNGKAWFTADSKNMFAENVGKKFKDASGMVDSWIGSSSHRENILNKDLKSGHIVVYNCDGVYYAVNSFSLYDTYKK